MQPMAQVKIFSSHRIIRIVWFTLQRSTTTLCLAVNAGQTSGPARSVSSDRFSTSRSPVGRHFMSVARLTKHRFL